MNTKIIRKCLPSTCRTK